MSGQQDVNNPFGDPEVNPFADPYVALSSNEKRDVPPPVVPTTVQLPAAKPPDYGGSILPPSSQANNPPSYYQSKPFSAEPVSQPGTLQGITPVFPGQPSYAPPPGSLNQAELERKAQELEAREKELNRLQKNSVKANNFPPVPAFCPVQPCFYHDISLEIPVNVQKTCKIMFYLWQFYVLTLFVNLISALAFLVGGEINDSSAGTTFGVSLVFLVFFAPCSFVCWYRPIYKALRDDSSFNYMVFFLVFFFQIMFCCLCALGISSFGTVGWINGIQQVSRGNQAVAAFMLITGLMWTVLSILMIFYLRRLHAAYRSSGASFEKAQGEFAVGLASNKAVQNVAIESMRAGIQGGPGQARN